MSVPTRRRNRPEARVSGLLRSVLAPWQGLTSVTIVGNGVYDQRRREA